MLAQPEPQAVLLVIQIGRAVANSPGGGVEKERDQQECEQNSEEPHGWPERVAEKLSRVVSVRCASDAALGKLKRPQVPRERVLVIPSSAFVIGSRRRRK